MMDNKPMNATPTTHVDRDDGWFSDECCFCFTVGAAVGDISTILIDTEDSPLKPVCCSSIDKKSYAVTYVRTDSISTE
jgi:hypothetical protein